MVAAKGLTGGRSQVDIALIHYPVLNRNREIIGSAVTNLDIHDIARAGRTYGVDNYYLVTPFADQHQLVREILDYWLEGHGAGYNEDRKEALSIVRLCNSVDELYGEVAAKRQGNPVVLATSAADSEKSLDYDQVRNRISAGESLLILFGTGWGMAPELMGKVDGFLPPIIGGGNYNHLSVRSAVSIVLDRLLSDR